jgi:hypothetical protein
MSVKEGLFASSETWACTPAPAVQAPRSPGLGARATVASPQSGRTQDQALSEERAAHHEGVAWTVMGTQGSTASRA